MKWGREGERLQRTLQTSFLGQLFGCSQDKVKHLQNAFLFLESRIDWGYPPAHRKENCGMKCMFQDSEQP